MIIEGSGDGANFTAGVTEENRLKAECVIMTEEHYINAVKGKSYTMLVSVTPTGPGDCFLYLKNNDEDPLVISELTLYCAADEFFQFKLGDIGIPIGGADAALTNRNAGSGNEADVTALFGADITGMSGGGIVAGSFVKGGENSHKIEPRSGIIIPKNKIFTGWVVTGTAAVIAGMGISFHHEH